MVRQHESELHQERGDVGTPALVGPSGGGGAALSHSPLLAQPLDEVTQERDADQDQKHDQPAAPEGGATQRQ
jgi:hypothetical protein